MQIFNFKNQSLESLTLIPNSIVLLKQSTYETKTGVNTYIKGVAVDGLKNTEPLTMVKLLLTTVVAEYKVKTKFENEFSNVTLANGKVEKSNITAKSVITPFLNTSILFHVDAKGKISTAIVLRPGMKFKDTALKITDKQLVVTCKHDDLRAAIHNQSKAVLSQFNYLNDIEAMIRELSSEAENHGKSSETETTTAKKPAKVATETTTAKVAKVA